jgi:hypothetical protein
MSKVAANEQVRALVGQPVCPTISMIEPLPKLLLLATRQ